MRLVVSLQQIAVIACAALLGACSPEPDVRLPRLGDDAVIMAFGDSLTYGTGAGREQSYPARLQQLVDRRVVNAGVPGETTGDGRQRLAQAVFQHQPDLILLCLGGNDFLRRHNVQATRDNLSHMIDWIQERDIPLVMLAVPEPKLLGGNHPLYRELAQQYDVILEDEIILEVLRDGSLKTDPIHPNAEGYEKIARAVAELLREAGAVD